MLKTSSVRPTRMRGVPIRSRSRSGTERILRMRSRRSWATAPCEKLASMAWETKFVTSLATPKAMKAQIRTAVVGSSLVRALLTKAISPALQAPLRRAMKVVSTIMPRQVRQMNFKTRMR